MTYAELCSISVEPLGANQFVIRTPLGNKLQSYTSTIAIVDTAGKVTLGPHWDYSVTTGKYRNRFLNETIKETREKIADGTYTVDLTL